VPNPTYFGTKVSSSGILIKTKNQKCKTYFRCFIPYSSVGPTRCLIYVLKGLNNLGLLGTCKFYFVHTAHFLTFNKLSNKIQHEASLVICVLLYFTQCILLVNVLNVRKCTVLTNSFLHSIATCRMRRFIAVLRSFFHSSLLCSFSCHPSPQTILPFYPTSFWHLFLGLPLNLLVPWIIYSTLLGILFSSILCTCPNQRNLFNVIVSIIGSFSTRY
jgi:hypothetical protein